MVCEGEDIRGPIFITKYAGRQDGTLPGFFPCDCEPRTTVIRNIRDLSICVNAPLERMPIPESNDERAIVIKAYGNQTTLTIQWTMVEEACNIVLHAVVVLTENPEEPAVKLHLFDIKASHPAPVMLAQKTYTESLTSCKIKNTFI